MPGKDTKKGMYDGAYDNIMEGEYLGMMRKAMEDLAEGKITKAEYNEVKKDFYEEFNEKIKNSNFFFLKDKNNLLYFDLRAFVIKKLSNCGILHIDNISLDSFSMEEEYFSHRRAKKLGENDYGRCISVIKKTIIQN